MSKQPSTFQTETNESTIVSLTQSAVKIGDYNLVELLCHYLIHEDTSEYGDEIEALLNLAIKMDCHDLIELLLKYNVNINGHLFTDSPLDTALVHQKFEIAEYLIQSGAKIDIGSALHSAVTNQIPGYMNFLLENYNTEITSFVSDMKYNLNELLVSAVKGGSVEILSHLIDFGADVNFIDKKLNVLLALSKNGEVAKFLISKGAYVNPKTGDESSPLSQILNRSWSSDKNNYTTSEIEVVKVLLENGALVNERNRKNETPIMMAASRVECVDMLQILLDYGADLNDQDDEGNTALMLAVENNFNENVSFLLQSAKENNQFINIQNKKGLTALMIAVVNHNLTIFENLIDSNADVNIQDFDGNTALLYVAHTMKGTNEEMLTILVKVGSDVNCQNNDGLSSLMLAAKLCWKEVILVLLEIGANVNAVSKKDCTKTALSFLSIEMYNREDMKPCLKMLLNKGADSSYVDPIFLSNLIISCEFEIIQEFIKCGHGPTESKIDLTMFPLYVNTNFKTVSPLSVALLIGNVSLARYFVDNLFLTSSDINLRKMKSYCSDLKQKRHQRCIDFVDEMFSQPMSLYQLTFVAVSSAVGASPGRKNRISMLPLPQIVKDKLNFNLEVVELNILEEDAHLFERKKDTNDDDDDSDDFYYNNDSYNESFDESDESDD